MIRQIVVLHSSILFDPKTKAWLKNISIKIDCQSGGIVEVYRREKDDIENGVRGGIDIDLRGKVVMPGFVDAHTHVFLHPYR